MFIKSPSEKIYLSLKQKNAINDFYNNKNIQYEKINCPICSNSYYKELFMFDRYRIKQKLF